MSLCMEGGSIYLWLYSILQEWWGRKMGERTGKNTRRKEKKQWEVTIIEVNILRGWNNKISWWTPSNTFFTVLHSCVRNWRHIPFGPRWRTPRAEENFAIIHPWDESIKHQTPSCPSDFRVWTTGQHTVEPVFTAPFHHFMHFSPTLERLRDIFTSWCICASEKRVHISLISTEIPREVFHLYSW